MTSVWLRDFQMMELVNVRLNWWPYRKNRACQQVIWDKVVSREELTEDGLQALKHQALSAYMDPAEAEG